MGITSLVSFLFTACSRSASRLAIVFTGLSLFFQQLVSAQAISSVEQTALTTTKLPAVTQKIVAAIYPFRMSTGQSSQPINNASQNTAVTFCTEILFKELRTSGWFTPVEYNNTGDLLNGQRDKQSVLTTAENINLSTSQKPTIIVEAGLFSHDETTGFDEAGVTHFPNSNSNRYRQDRTTIFLRVLSAQSGKILKTIYVTKAVLSQLVGGNTYRYVFIGRSSVPINGTTSVSPDQLVITEAIKQAVRGLIIEGVRDGLWMTNTTSTVQIQNVISAYEAERTELNQFEEPNTPSRKTRSAFLSFDPPFITLCLYGGLMRYHGDYVNWDTKGAYGLSVETYATPYIGLHLNASTGVLSSQKAFSTHLTSISVNLMVRVLPYWRLTPIVYGGLGMVSRTTENPIDLQGSKYLQYQGGLGLQYSLTNTVGFRTMLTYNQPMTDMLDGKQIGNHNDFYVQTTFGLLVNFGRFIRGSN